MRVSVYMSTLLCVNVLKHIYVYVPSRMKQESKKRLSELIKQIRGTSTQKEFAKRLGVTTGAIQAWENAEVTPGGSNLMRIAKESGTTLEELIAYLEGETTALNSTEIEIDYLVRRIATMPPKQLALIGRVVSDRLVAIAERG